jgi:hypothetical protein
MMARSQYPAYHDHMTVTPDYDGKACASLSCKAMKALGIEVRYHRHVLEESKYVQSSR